jgi:pterin-4a-carbinolamine dehydratase
MLNPMAESNQTTSVGGNNFSQTVNFLRQVATQDQQDNQNPNFTFQQSRLVTTNDNSVSDGVSKLDSKQTNLNDKSSALQQHLNDLLHQQSLSLGAIQSVEQIKHLNQEVTSSSFNQKNLPVLGQNPKLHWQSTKPMVKTKKKTRQTNLIPTLLIITLLVGIGTLGYISYYLYSQNQSLQKQAYTQSNNLKQDARLQKLIQTYEQEIANLQQKLNSLEQCHKSTTNSD